MTEMPPAVATKSPTAFPPSPEATASPTPACAEAGTWVEFVYQGVAVAAQVPALIYLPPCYAAESDAYPVAYFLHGKPYTEEQWVNLGLADLVDESAYRGSLPPMIVVLARQPEPLFSNSDGGQGSYETEFLEGLVRAVDLSFRTEVGPEGRAVVGLSRGGVWALEIGMRNPGQIGAVAALSPALAVNHAREPYDPLRLATTGDPLPPRFLLGAGETDWARGGTEAIAAELSDRGIASELVIVPGNHSDPTWQALLPSVMAFLNGAFAPALR
jgi:enterochelin esterase-like enzyme